jgi:hypothetical protein
MFKVQIMLEKDERRKATIHSIIAISLFVQKRMILFKAKETKTQKNRNTNQPFSVIIYFTICNLQCELYILNLCIFTTCHIQSSCIK